MRTIIGNLLTLALCAPLISACGGPETAPADPTCFDGRRNGDETDLDCGGICGASCVIDQACALDGDCRSGFCAPATGQCAAPVVFSDLTFTVVEGLTLGEFAGLEDARILLTSAAAFEALLGVAAPAELDFSTQWALFHSAGPHQVPGHRTSVDRLEAASDSSELRLSTTLVQPDPTTCETFQHTRPTWALVRFDQLSLAPATLTETRTPNPVDCTGGAIDYATCTEEVLCGPGLICGGITWGTSGMCIPSDQAGVFSESLTVAIPDDGTLALTRSLEVTGLATVDMDVVVSVELDHPAPTELWIGLENPSGNQTLVWDHEPGPGGTMTIIRNPRGLSGDESVNGTWTLTVRDDVTGNAGQLLSWSVEILSRYD